MGAKGYPLDKQMQVLALHAAGHGKGAIARSMGVSLSTVKRWCKDEGNGPIIALGRAAIFDKIKLNAAIAADHLLGVLIDPDDSDKAKNRKLTAAVQALKAYHAGLNTEQKQQVTDAVIDQVTAQDPEELAKKRASILKQLAGVGSDD